MQRPAQQQPAQYYERGRYAGEIEHAEGYDDHYQFTPFERKRLIESDGFEQHHSGGKYDAHHSGINALQCAEDNDVVFQIFIDREEEKQ